MIDLEATRARVRDIQFGGARYFKSVSDAVTAADAIENFDSVVPAAYVYIGRETAERNKLVSNGRMQRVASTINVLFALGAQRADGERADPLEITRGLIIQSLTGWTPPGALKALDWTSYSIRSMGNGLIWGECLFAAGWLLEGPQ